MREGSPSLLLMTTTLPTTRPPNPLPTRAVVCANRVRHCSRVSKASVADSLMGAPSARLSSVHSTHAHSARAVTVEVSRQNATSIDVRHATRIIGCPPRSFLTTSGSPVASRAATQYQHVRSRLLPCCVVLHALTWSGRPPDLGLALYVTVTFAEAIGRCAHPPTVIPLRRPRR